MYSYILGFDHYPCTFQHTQVLRVLPYSAAQLYSYELFKQAFSDGEGRLGVPARLAAGACAGMTSTLVSDAHWTGIPLLASSCIQNCGAGGVGASLCASLARHLPAQNACCFLLSA